MAVRSEYRVFFLIFWIFIGSKVILQFIDASEVSSPNIIVVLTDDQDEFLNGMEPMERTRELLGNNGATFTNAFTSSPVCCPARSSILSGQYAHNHLTFNNSGKGNCYTEYWKSEVEPRTFPVFLKENGYNTFYAGKYLNNYYATVVPPGYDEFYGLHGNSVYYNYTLTENGVRQSYGNQEQDYLTDVLSNKLQSFISKQQSDIPFLAIVAPPAAHSPFTAAKRHENAFQELKALRTPNFNLPSEELQDKHWLVRMKPAPLDDAMLGTIDDYFRRRWRTLLSVDELIDGLVSQLIQMNLYENTYIVYTSDNGYHLGQFSMPFDKRQPYETDIRVPFIVTGPGIREKQEITDPILSIDLMPTILDWARIQKPTFLDGQSISSLINTSQTTQNMSRKLLIEYWGEGNLNTFSSGCPWSVNDQLFGCTKQFGCHCQDSWNNTYNCVRDFTNDSNRIYCEFNDFEQFVEAYDMAIDPYELRNIRFDLSSSEQEAYRQQIEELRQCAGDSCRIY